MTPDAKWISCRELAVGTFNVLKCLQWLLAPTDLNDNNPNPDFRPHSISHSSQ